MSSYAVDQEQSQSLQVNFNGSVLEEELQEKGAMFRDFLTSRVQ